MLYVDGNKFNITLHVKSVLEKMDKGIPTTASGAPKMEQSQAQFHSWRHCACCQDQDKFSGQACHKDLSASRS